MVQGILGRMLERLFASLMNGPALNCRPHSSRQRVDVSQLARLGDVTPEAVLMGLLGEERGVRVVSQVKRPAKLERGGADPSVELSEEERRGIRQWTEQQTVMGKLRTIAEDARTYEQDTGVHVLNIGFPLLSVPPGKGGRGRQGSRRIVAPIAFIPVTLEVKGGGVTAVEIGCRGEGVDLVRPNIALMAWLEQQTGKPGPEVFDDREAEDPWREIRELVGYVSKALGLAMPAMMEAGSGVELKLSAAPKATEEQAAGEIVMAAVLGLYPMANEGLLRDTQAMVEEREFAGPLRSFLTVNVDGEEAHKAAGEEGPVVEKRVRQFSEERLVTAADPCQSRAALLARKADGLVIHGPPGTGKSQTITNIIGDHLARGQRVLMVCDKRTALDVVAHRLNHLGFGGLTALVHDPQRDQRELYRAIRERLEGLGSVRTHAGAAKELEKIDAELQTLHGELTAYWRSLMAGGKAAGGAGSFHDLMGEWLGIEVEAGLEVERDSLKGVGLEEGRAVERLVREMLERGVIARYGENGWVGAVGMGLGKYLARPMSDFVAMMEACVASAREADGALEAGAAPLGEEDLAEQARVRRELADRLERLTRGADRKVLARWADAEVREVRKGELRLRELKEPLEVVGKGALEADLVAVVRGSGVPGVAEVAARLGKLAEYGEAARKWYGFLCFRQKRLGREVLSPLGLALSNANGERARIFYEGLRARLVMREGLGELLGEPATGWPDDGDLRVAAEDHAGALELRSLLGEQGAGGAEGRVREAMKNPEGGAATVEALRKSAGRAEGVKKCVEHLGGTGLFTAEWLGQFEKAARSGQSAAAVVERLAADLRTLEQVIRIRDGVAGLPGGMRGSVVGLLKKGASADAGVAGIEKGLLAAEIGRRLGSDPGLQSMDGQRLKSAFERYRKLDAGKRGVVCAAALHHWTTRQKERLLASTLSRLSPMGADLKRRLTLRGERAMRLRQVIDVGAGMEGGDPLWDMCPVWMASPETVAQLFPRQALFDVVIFDEASQCRLEEALPVLMRGKRVVVAGDPKQLPPTRFFESAVVASEEEEAEGEQGLFERQQGEVEDLLTAALNLPIENAYLDVHYRSRNSDLIAFSNDQFYGHRLQAIPGHPANRTRFCPLTMYRVDGVYEERKNEKEADRVVGIVRDLLRRAQPPSIGIACFNLVQRDLIVEKLEAAAGLDADFAGRLAGARARKGAGSFEGLFVKNLENVQGDERDHIIISTTYGPTREGKFHQRFGPLGRAGGGRRLNVLITRAREEVHLVTSIPREQYSSLPPVPPDQAPGGAYLLYAYLRFAEVLGEAYKEAGAQGEEAAGVVRAAVRVHEQKASMPSVFSEQLAKGLLQGRGMGSDVHWGNDGFCVDLAMAHPRRADDVTIGVLCDGNRYQEAADPVEWDAFRTAVHESQGWKLHRLWTPQFFRDPDAHLASIVEEIEEHLATERPPDALGVVSERL